MLDCILCIESGVEVSSRIRLTRLLSGIDLALYRISAVTPSSGIDRVDGTVSGRETPSVDTTISTSTTGVKGDVR